MTLSTWTMKPRMALATLAAVAALTVFGAAPASADPPPDFTFDLHCETLGTVTVVSFSNGDPSPGLDVGSNRVLTIYEWEITVHGYPYVGDPFVRYFSWSHPGAPPQNGRLDYCTYHYDIYNSTGHGVFDGSAVVSYTP